MKLGDKVYILELHKYGVVRGIVEKRATLVKVVHADGKTEIIDVINYTVLVVTAIDRLLPILGRILRTIKSWFK